MWKMPLLSMNVPGSCSGLQNFSRKQGVGLSLSNCSKGVLETPSLPGSAGKSVVSLSRNESETGIHTIFEPLLVTAR